MKKRKSLSSYLKIIWTTLKINVTTYTKSFFKRLLIEWSKCLLIKMVHEETYHCLQLHVVSLVLMTFWSQTEIPPGVSSYIPYYLLWWKRNVSHNFPTMTRNIPVPSSSRNACSFVFSMFEIPTVLLARYSRIKAYVYAVYDQSYLWVFLPW